MRNRILLIITLALMITLPQGCRIGYSFTGTSIPPDVKTVSIQLFPNQAPLFQPTLSQTFTEKLKDKITAQTNLQLVPSGGHMNFEGEITNYTTSPIAITGNETAAMNRLTITVHVKFTNTKDSKQDFDTSFSQYEDYDSKKSLSAEEAQLIDAIVEKLTDDIFNKSMTNW